MTDAEIRSIRQEIAQIRAELEHIKSALMPAKPVVRIPGVSPTQLAILATLASRAAVSEAGLRVIIGHDGTDMQPKNIHVHVSRLRQKLAPYGITIPRRVGDDPYQMSERDRQVIQSWLAGQPPERVAAR